MYEGFQNDKSCLKHTLAMVQKLKSKDSCRICSFIYSTNDLHKSQDEKESLTLPSNLHLFLVMKDQRVMSWMNFYRVYDYQYFCLEKDMYYDLFHFLNQEIQYDVFVRVKTEHSLKCLE